MFAAPLILFAIIACLALLLWVCILIGVTLQGGVNGNYPLVAAVYAAEIRATGLG